MGVFDHGETGLLVWNRVFFKDLRFPDPSFPSSLHYSLISSTFLRICADPSRAGFWMVSKESDTLTMARKVVRWSVIVPNAPNIIGMTVVCTPHSFEIFRLRSSYFSVFSFSCIFVLISPGTAITMMPHSFFFFLTKINVWPPSLSKLVNLNIEVLNRFHIFVFNYLVCSVFIP